MKYRAIVLVLTAGICVGFQLLYVVEYGKHFHVLPGVES